jgi:16S rRNA (guanine966-N2)-methyltransferase
LIFLDPPYGQGLAEQALAALQAAGWVAADALIAIETGSKEALQPVPGFAIQDHRRYGRAAVWLLTLE